MEEKRIENFSELGQAFAEAKNQTKADIQRANEDIKRDIEAFKELVPQIPGIAAHLAERGVQQGKAYILDEVDRINTEFGDVDSQTLAYQIEILQRAAEKNSQSRQWESANEGRNGKVVRTVKGIEDFTTNVRATIATKSIKITSLIAKGMALFGRKNQAKEMQARVAEKAEQYVGKETKATSIAKRAAKNGFEIVDNVRSGIQTGKDFARGTAQYASDKLNNYVQQGKDGIEEVSEIMANKLFEVIDSTIDMKDSAVRGAKAGVDKAKDVAHAIATNAVMGYDMVKDSIKDGALALGVATYKGAATVMAVGELQLDAAESGAKFVGGKMMEGAEVAKDYTELATKKVSLAKSKLGLGVKSFFAKKVASLSQMLSESVLVSKKEVIGKTTSVVIKEEEMKFKNSKQDEGPEL